MSQAQNSGRRAPAAIPPHGGVLVNLLAKPDVRAEWEAKAEKLPRHVLSQREQCDLELMSVGGLSPLAGFMGQKDYRRVVEEMRLADGTVWSVPVVLSIKKADAADYREGGDAAFWWGDAELLAILDLKERYEREPHWEAKNVYRTEEEAHPGVAHLYGQGHVLLGGPVTTLRLPTHEDFLEHRRTPAELRAHFAEQGWRRIVAFQTRNPMHRAHEYLTKCALEVCDGLLLHPLVGETKGDDVPAEIRMRSYEVMLAEYFPKKRTALAVLEASMRYAGPREAIFHAIIRKNYGCTHFIVGRDHAGVGNYYG